MVEFIHVMNRELRTKATNDFENDCFKLMNKSVFQKTIENVGKHKDIRLVATVIKRSRLVAVSNYYTTKRFSEKLAAVRVFFKHFLPLVNVGKKLYSN